MIWDSITLMTVIDVLIIGAAGYSFWVFLNHRRKFPGATTSLGFSALVLGLSSIALFYLFDLATMHVLPLFMPMSKAMAVMEDLHHNYPWTLTLVAVVAITTGFGAIGNGVFTITDKLGKSEARLLNAQRIARLGNWEWGIESGKVDLSDQIYDIFGITPESFAGTYEAFIEYIHPADRELFKEAARKALDEKASLDVEYRIVRPDTLERIIHSHGEVESDPSGKPVRISGTVQDITEIRSVEREIEQKSALLDTTFENMSQGLVVIDADLKLAAFNQRYIDFRGYPPGFIRIGMPLEEIVRFNAERGEYGPVADIDALVRERVAARRKGDRARRERTLPDGRVIAGHREPMPDGGYVTTLTDITERKKAEREIAEKSALLETTFESMSQGISVYDADLKLVAYNQKFIDLQGLPPDFLRLGMPYADFFRFNAERGEYGPGDVEEKVRERIDRARRGGAVGIERTRPDGTVLAIQRDPLPEGGCVTTFTDITERRRTEKELVESRRRFAGILEIADDAIISMDEEQNIEIFNKGAENIFGYGAAEVLGKPLDMLLPSGFAQAHKRHVKNFGDSPETARIMGELREVFGLRKDGSVFPCEISISHLELNGKHVFTAFLRDVTSWKRAEEELRIAMEEAMAANRTKSEFLANMSHELRTPLNAIIGFSEVMQKGTLGPVGNPKFLEYADDINESGQHLLSMINDILDLSKIEVGKIELSEETIDVTSILRSCLTLVKERAFDKDLKLTCEIPDDLPMLRADGRKLKQIVINLLSNAVKFTDPGGEVMLKAWFRPLGGFVLQVTDNGIGIALEDIPKALEPFSQVDSELSRKYDGTGLGLPLTKSLVEIHGGSFDLQSKLGVGTTVTARFPAERIVYTATKAATTTHAASSGSGG